MHFLYLWVCLIFLAFNPYYHPKDEKALLGKWQLVELRPVPSEQGANLSEVLPDRLAAMQGKVYLQFTAERKAGKLYAFQFLDKQEEGTWQLNDDYTKLTTLSIDKVRYDFEVLVLTPTSLQLRLPIDKQNWEYNFTKITE
ncbi:MAG TPA: hypothetical protein DCM08_05935 [Microscillaceae bacterium]|jgi:hypothetical protein|nr:hypothetical protein [Microscillaceae bacterium]